MLKSIQDQGELNQEWNEMLASVLDGSPLGCVLIDSSGIIHYTNKRLRDSFGYRWKDDLVGKPLTNLLEPRFTEVHGQHIAKWFQYPREMAMVERMRDAHPAGLPAVKRTGEKIRLNIQLSSLELSAENRLFADSNGDPITRLGIGWVEIRHDA